LVLTVAPSGVINMLNQRTTKTTTYPAAK
jgi:hypothetical protein